MRSRILSIALLASALFINSSLPAQKATTRPVTIVVNDQMGAVIAHAQIRLTPAPDPAPANTETDDQGRLSMNLKPGSYTLLVSSVGFSKLSQHIEIGAPEGSADTVLLVQVMLIVDPSIHGTAVYAADTLVLSGDRLQVPVTLSLTEFHALPHVSVTVHNAHTSADEIYSGVPLAVLLAKLDAPLGQRLRGKALASYIVASGLDGYTVVLSIAEADPSFHSGEILVAETRDGQPLGKSGPFQLIVSEDEHPARWVHNLVLISLQDAR
jgi:hypothetical protein